MPKLIVYCTVPHYGGIYSVYRRIRQAIRGSDWQIKCVCLASELKDWYGYDPALADEDVVVLDDAGLDFSGSCRLFLDWLGQSGASVLIPGSSKIAVSSVPWAPAECHVVTRCVDITPLALRLATANYGHLSKIIHTSPRQAKELKSKHNCSRAILAHIPNTLDPVESFCYRPPLAEEPVKLVFFDRLDEPQKAVSMIPGILKGLIKRGYSASIDIIGDGPAKGSLAEALRKQGLSSLARLHGSLTHDAAFGIIRNCHFLIKPTRFEGFPSSLLEATVQGVFPICSDIAGVTDWILRDAAFLAKLDDENSFCEKIDWALRNPDLAVTKHRLLTDQFEQRFGFENFRKNWLDLLGRLESVAPNGIRRSDCFAIKKHRVFHRGRLRILLSKLIQPNLRRKLRELLSEWGERVALRARMKSVQGRVSRMRAFLFKTLAAIGRPIASFPPGSVLVMAPHPDDEVFACGGLMASKLQRGEKVSVLFMTNGEASHDGCCYAGKEQIAHDRRVLTEKALNEIGGGRIRAHWLNIPDGKVPSPGAKGYGQIVEDVRNVIESLGPDHILVPHEFDAHSDHINTNKIAMAAVGNSSGSMFFYPVWMLYRFPRKFFLRRVRGRVLKLDISQVHARKMKAIALYEGTTNPACPHRAPLIGELPESLMRELKKRYEIYIKPA